MLWFVGLLSASLFAAGLVSFRLKIHARLTRIVIRQSSASTCFRIVVVVLRLVLILRGESVGHSIVWETIVKHKMTAGIQRTVVARTDVLLVTVLTVLRT